MEVVKRNGKREPVMFDKITERIKQQSYSLSPMVDSIKVAMRVIEGLYDGVSTSELDNLAAETAASMTISHPDYAQLAARIAISNLHSNTSKSFSETMNAMYHYVNPRTQQEAPLLSEEVHKVIMENAAFLDSHIIYNRDFNYDYFGFKTLERSYLLRINGKIVERPQHMLMRVSVGIHLNDLKAVIETYDLMSKKYFTHATPTLFNAGTPKPQMSSCFLLAMQDDSIDGIYDTLKQTAKISQSAGGIGLSIHNVRATGSYIRGTNGTSNGIVPMLRVFNDTARYVDQCFHPDTIVYTKNGVKNIGDVAIHEELLTDDGTYNSVTRLLRNDYNGEMIKISVKQSLEPVLVTPSHLFLVLKNQQKMTNFDVIRNRLDKKIAEPEWIEAKDLTEDDLICFPKSKFEQDIAQFSEKDCRFYGLMLGDGHISKDGKQAHITCNKETDDIDFMTTYLSDNGIRYTTSTEEDSKKIRYTWSAHLGFKFSRTMLYDANDEKIIHHTMTHLPKEKAMQIVKGIIESDGTIGKRESQEIALDMTSRSVIESVRFILMRFGILTSGYIRDRIGEVSSYKNITTKKISYCLRFPKVKEITDLFGIDAGEFVSFLQHGDYAFSRVDAVSTEEYNGLVVDFEVEPNHNYVTHIGIAHNGGGKRKGSFAIYIEPWHADIFEFLDLKKNTGKEEMRARDLFFAMWTSDLFMKRVQDDAHWTLMCPNECPGLYDVYGDEFEAMYTNYEEIGKGRKTIKARELWEKILESQIETGTPYMLYKDAANRKSNQKNLGTIRSSNLCTEILEYTSKDEIAVCNLASISLPMFVENGEFNHDLLYTVTKRVTRNLNKVIDRNYYPVKEAENSNLRHRPVGLGVQGLADAFIMLRMPFTSDEAKKLNQEIFETLYFAAVTASMEMAIEEGAYSSFKGSPISNGEFQFNLWGLKDSDLSGRWDWENLRKEVIKNGVRNSLLVAPMPTASTSQILGNNEAFEPYTSNIYTRRVLSGEFIIVNKHLLNDLVALNLWNEDLKQEIMRHNGSVQNIDRIPQNLKDLYKTVWEMSMKDIIDMSRHRGYFIDQSQSLNLFMQDANYAKLTSMHFYAWQSGLKTGMYYLRTKAAVDAIKFTLNNDKKIEIAPRVEPQTVEVQIENEEMSVADFQAMLARSRESGPEECEMCGS